MDFVIRRATAEEYDTLGEITAHAYLGDGLLDFGDDDAYLHELRAVAKRAAAAEVLVAAADGGVLGGATFVPSGGPMADIARPGEAEIRMLAVAREARGRGAGEALVRACVERARSAPGPCRAACGSCSPPSAPCTAPTASTSAWVSPAPRTATGIPCRSWTTSLCSPTN